MSKRSGQSKLFYGYVVTAAGFTIWLVGWGTFTPSFSVFFKPLLAEFGWSRAEASLAYSLSFMVLATFGIVIGWLTDKLGPRRVVIVFGSFLGICYLLMSQINALWQFQMNLALLGGMGISAITVPVMVTVSRWFIKERGLMIGIVQAGNGVGGFIFPPFAGWLILTYSWRSAYVVFGIITLLGIIIAGYFLRRDPRDMGQLPDGESLDLTSEAKRFNPGLQGVGFPLREAIHTRQFWMIAGLYCSFGFCRSTFLAHIAAHTQDLGFSLTDGANVLAVITGSSMFGRVGMGRVADRIGNRQAFMISFAITTVSLILGLVARDLWKLYLFALLFGFGWGNQAVLRVSLTSEVFGLTSLGLIMGTLGFAESGAATFGSFFAGYIFDVFANYQPVFWMGIGVSIMGIILAWLLKPAMRRDP
jgi:MFS family permease